MAYVKLDCGILDSTLWVDRDVREVFITALLMAEAREFTAPLAQLHCDRMELTGFEAPAGWYGFVPAAGAGIVRRAMVEPVAGMRALGILGEPDVESRSKRFEGRRLIRVDGGYLVLNFMEYRDRDYTMAARARRYRERRKLSVGVTPVTRDNVTSHRNVTQSESESESDLNPKSQSRRGSVRGSERRAARLPDDFVLTDAMRQAAEVEHLDADRTFARFCDHWRAASGANARKLDWLAAWRNWCRNEADRAKANGTRPFNGRPTLDLTAAQPIRALADRIAKAMQDYPQHRSDPATIAKLAACSVQEARIAMGV